MNWQFDPATMNAGWKAWEGHAGHETFHHRQLDELIAQLSNNTWERPCACND